MKENWKKYITMLAVFFIALIMAMMALYLGKALVRQLNARYKEKPVVQQKIAVKKKKLSVGVLECGEKIVQNTGEMLEEIVPKSPSREDALAAMEEINRSAEEWAEKNKPLESLGISSFRDWFKRQFKRTEAKEFGETIQLPAVPDEYDRFSSLLSGKEKAFVAKMVQAFDSAYSAGLESSAYFVSPDLLKLKDDSDLIKFKKNQNMMLAFLNHPDMQKIHKMSGMDEALQKSWLFKEEE